MIKLLSLTCKAIIIMLVISFTCQNLNGKWLNKGKYQELDTNFVGYLIKISKNGDKAYTTKDSTIFFYDLKIGNLNKSVKLKFYFTLDGDITDSGDLLIFPSDWYTYPAHPTTLRKYLFDKDTNIRINNLGDLWDGNRWLLLLDCNVKLLKDDTVYALSRKGSWDGNPSVTGGALEIYRTETDLIDKSIVSYGSAGDDFIISDNPKFFGFGGDYDYKFFNNGLISFNTHSNFYIYDSTYKKIIESGSSSYWDIQNGGSESQYGPENLSDFKAHPYKDEVIYNKGTYRLDLQTKTYGKYAIMSVPLIDFSYSNNDKYLISIDSSVVRLHLSENFDVFDTINVQTYGDEKLLKINLVRDSLWFYVNSTTGILRKFYIDSILSKFEARFTADSYNIKLMDSVSFFNLSPGEPTSYRWNFGDGNTSTLKNPVHQYKQKGNYTVELIVSDGQRSDTLIKNNIIVVEVPNSINFEKENQLHSSFIQPNPATDFIEITKPSEGLEPSEGSSNKIRIFNVFGEAVSTSVCSADTSPGGGQKIDVSGLPSGVYFVRVGDKVGKFIKI